MSYSMHLTIVATACLVSAVSLGFSIAAVALASTQRTEDRAYVASLTISIAMLITIVVSTITWLVSTV